jgi:predicted HTH transcriptional regulator
MIDIIVPTATIHKKELSAEENYIKCKEAVGCRYCHRFEKRIGSGSLKPSTNRMLNRIKCIYMFIRNNGTVTTQELVEEFGITPRTIQRDLNVLAYNDLVISPSRGKWTTTEKKVKLSS